MKDVTAEDNYCPESPEGIALRLMQIIDKAEEADGRRQRSNASEKERLIALYKDCLTAVTGLDCARPITLH